MKTFLIGDGQKSTQVDDAYLCDWESESTQAFTRADRPGFILRVTVITITLNQGVDPAKLRIDLREKAARGGYSPIETGTTTYYLEPPKPTEDNDLIHFAYVAIENHKAIFSITFPTGFLDSLDHTAAVSDVRQMIESLTVRHRGESTSANLTLTDHQKIKQAVSSIMEFTEKTNEEVALPEALQRASDKVLDGTLDESFAEKIGLAMGYLFVSRIEGLNWRMLVDDDGGIFSLVYEDTSITVFPTAMVWKRIGRKEHFIIEDLFAGVSDVIEDFLKKGY